MMPRIPLAHIRPILTPIPGMELIQFVDAASVMLSLLFFGLGSILDLRTREVPDRVWLIYGPIGLALTLTRVMLNQQMFVLVLASIGLTTLVSLTMFYLGIFGGADAKATICLGLTLALAPGSITPVFGYVHPFFPIVVLVISFVCSASVAIWLGLRNLAQFLIPRTKLFDGLSQEPWWKKALAFLTGYPAEVTRLRSTFYLYPMEKVVSNSTGAHRKFHLHFNAESDRDQMLSNFLESHSKVGSPNIVWVTPGLPMLVFMLMGLVITLIFGDAIFSVLFLTIRR